MKSKCSHNQIVLGAEALCQESIPPTFLPAPLPGRVLPVSPASLSDPGGGVARQD